MPANRADLAIQYRLHALNITKEALNAARQEVREQIRTGRVNPLAIETVGGQGGSSPTKIDVYMDNFIKRRVAQIDASVTYSSEESRSNISPEDGDIFAWCDPLDGTTNCFTLFGAYAVVLYFDRYIDGKVDHLAGAIASFDGSVVSWQHFANEQGDVFIDWPVDFFWPGSELERPSADEGLEENMYSLQMQGRQFKEPGIVPIHTGVPQRFAAVAANVGRRRDLDSLFELHSEPDGTSKNSRLFFSTLGGNPCVAPLLVSQLGAVIEPHRVKLHDAAYLLPLVLAGGVVVDPNDTNELPVFRTFGTLVPKERYIGPFIASAGEDAIRELMQRRRT